MDFTVLFRTTLVTALAAMFTLSAPALLNAKPDPQAGTVFSKFPGRWVGEGRLMFKDSKFESVKCRATYFLSEDGNELRQNIRCAAPSGKIDVKGVLTNDQGVLGGSWLERLYDLEGSLSGKFIPNGLRVLVEGKGLRANMQILFHKERQIVEIQFFDSTLVGMTMILKRG